MNSNNKKNNNLNKVKRNIIDTFNGNLPMQIFIILLIGIFTIFVFLNFRVVIRFLMRIIEILFPIFIGWVLAYVVAPVYNFTFKLISSKKVGKKFKLKKHTIAKIVSTIVCTLFVLLCMVGIIFLFVPQLYSSISNFLGKIGIYITQVLGAIDNLKIGIDDANIINLLNNLQKVIKDTININNFNNIKLDQIFLGVYNGFYFSFKAILNFFVGLVVMIYSLNIKDELITNCKKFLFAVFSFDLAKKILVEMKFAHKVFSGFLVGKIVDSVIIGLLCYICCSIMKMPYTPLISVIVGVTNIIPFFGPFIGAIPSFVIILLEQPFSIKPYGFLLFILILQQLDGNVIGPKIIGDKTGVKSFWVLFSILLFGGLFGFLGMIIAVPLWAIITRLVNKFILLRLNEKKYPLNDDEKLILKQYYDSLKDENLKK